MSEPLTDVEIEGVMRYWEQPTGMANAPGGMVEAARSNLASFKATIDTLTARLTELEGADIALEDAIAEMRRIRKERDKWKAAVFVVITGTEPGKGT